MTSFRFVATAAMVAALSSIGAANAQPVDWSKAQTIEISMTNYAFTPSTLQLRVGTPYRLHFVNHGSKDHNFDSPELFRAMSIVPEDQSRIEDGTVELDEGQAADVRVTPVKAGTYEFHCSHFLHSAFGMTGKAVIQ